jgi:DNA primase
MARCPLHEDRTPSLSLYQGRDGRARWHCHGCGVGGDALDLEAALSGQRVEDVIRG